jgi:hypothetical protein
MIYLPAHLLILFGLIWLLVRTEKPFLCSGIYAGAHMFFSLLLEVPWWLIVLLGIIAFGLASLYFWLAVSYPNRKRDVVDRLVGRNFERVGLIESIVS